MENEPIEATYARLTLRRALLAAPPPLALDALRTLATKRDAWLAAEVLVSLRARIAAWSGETAAREVDILFDVGTGRSRATPTAL